MQKYERIWGDINDVKEIKLNFKKKSIYYKPYN